MFSDFGNKLQQDSGILQLMDDLGAALAHNPPKAMFGGGNPAQIPEVTAEFQQSLERILKNDELKRNMFGSYDTPQGNAAFITAVCELLNREYDLGISEENVAITSGSQTGFFILFNLIAGMTNGVMRKILFPMVPEYIGYVDQGLDEGMFESVPPIIERIDKHSFKYHVDFNNVKIGPDIAALCVSRPTNPSGNVVADDDLRKLADLAEKHNTLLVVDNAYGNPFPGVITKSASLFWQKNMVISMSLSKVGLPTSRVGIFIARPEIARAISSANAIVSLASPSIGQYIAAPLISSGRITQLCERYIQPYYQQRLQKMNALIGEHFPDDLPWRMHRYEGSYFHWLWLEGAKKSSSEIYEDLKSRGVLVVPGDYFFPGQKTSNYNHMHECLRLNFARPDQELELGVPILADAIRRAYGKRL